MAQKNETAPWFGRRQGRTLAWTVALAVLLPALLAALLPALLVGQTAGAQQYHWTMQSLWQAGSINHRVFENFCENVKRLTGGRLEITRPYR